MISMKMTKSKLGDYLSVFSSALNIHSKFTIMNDIIDPTIPESETDVDDGVFGAHRLKHPLFTLTEGRLYKSVDNLSDIITEIKNRTGIKDIYLVNTNTTLEVQMDKDIYILAVSNGIDTGSRRMFDDIVSLYIKDEIYVFEDNQLLDCRNGSVVTIYHDVYGPVRLSKSNFPFMGVARTDSSVNFSGRYSYGYYNEDLQEHYIAMHINYKRCEAFHMYVFVPFTIE